MSADGFDLERWQAMEDKSYRGELTIEEALDCLGHGEEGGAPSVGAASVLCDEYRADLIGTALASNTSWINELLDGCADALSEWADPPYHDIGEYWLNLTTEERFQAATHMFLHACADRLAREHKEEADDESEEDDDRGGAA